MKTNKVYFAHSMRIYDTPEEEELLEFLRGIFPNLVCPNKDLNLGNCMERYTDYVRFKSGLVVLAEYKGFVGRGVYLEAKEALSCGTSVLVVRNKKLYTVTGLSIHDPNDWKIKHATVSIE